jgi:putative spermidine/putrescine transport system ATP-binding protein
VAPRARSITGRGTAFVARFIGGHKVLTGQVVATGQESALLTAPGGQQFVVPTPDVAVGQAVTFAIRSDKVRLLPASLPPQTGARPETPSVMSRRNALHATVRTLAYQGAWVQLSLEIPAFEEFTVTMPDSTFFEKPVAVGSPVVATWAVEDVHRLHEGCRLLRPGSPPTISHKEMPHG